jgi:hypothetical protein
MLTQDAEQSAGWRLRPGCRSTIILRDGTITDVLLTDFQDTQSGLIAKGVTTGRGSPADEPDG